MGNLTKGNLQAAKIYEVDKKTNKKVAGGLEVACMFNPYEYKVSKTNTFSEKPKNDSDVAQAEFESSGPQTLNLTLYFDTYNTDAEKIVDVSLTTRKLWDFMMTKNQKNSSKGKKVEPPFVAFEWGVFCFVAYITNMIQTFTLFSKDGIPVRAKVELTFTQYVDVDDYKSQIPGGTTYEQSWKVVTGDRIDLIAEEVYGNPGMWRQIAERNHITNPLVLRPGQILQVPLD